jgi:hypothetical protein
LAVRGSDLVHRVKLAAPAAIPIASMMITCTTLSIREA